MANKGRKYINFNTCTECKAAFERPNNGTKMSYAKCPDCVLDAAVLRQERRTKHKCANPECGELTQHAKLVPHDGELICGACYGHITAMQDSAYTMDKHMETQSMYSSGLGECGSNPANDEQRKAGRIGEYKGGAKKKVKNTKGVKK